MAGKQTRLSRRSVELLTCPEGRKDALFFDDALRGFAVRVTAAGSKVFLLQYKHAGRVRRLQLGEYGPVTVDQARKLAEIARGDVKRGLDPKGDINAKRQEALAASEARQQQKAAEMFTLRALVAAWRASHLEPNRRGRYAAESERIMHMAFPRQLDAPAASLTPATIIETLDAIAADRGAAAASRAFRTGHAAYAWTVGRQRLSVNPFSAVPAPQRIKARDRALTDEELGAVWRAAERLGQPFGPFVRMLILTLQRREEVAGMRRSELSRDSKTWTQPASRTKNKRPHIVHLVPQARAILRAQPTISRSDLVFTTTGLKPISGFSGAKRQLDRLIAEERKALGLAPAEMQAWRLHDLRRTGVSAMARLGVLPDVADRVLNHQASSTNEGVKAVYQVHSFAAERERALALWAAHVQRSARLLRQGKTAAVIPFPAKPRSKGRTS